MINSWRPHYQEKGKIQIQIYLPPETKIPPLSYSASKASFKFHVIFKIFM